ncbi:hypothetical protein TRFO_09734 [Tritrichomonas foetus]|uniref:Uncharacterized protein n=1 Tax=Tritrichomonas foetus TaxID=1144522 RepID=A0A1J4JHY6_9EUKA|nr:hypothetical protein TRFO_09734 [Tritrichomonas foetus]|eukprot:OHS96844.1 hypothetical protein TRFO_09734 [Tritrichomonas foetus]
MAFISRIISKFLDRYIQQVSKTQIVTKAFDGHVELHNVSLQPDILTNFGIPLQILQNNIENMVIDYPFLQKGSHSAYLKIQNMDLLAKPDWDVLYKVEINSIASLLKSIADEKEASKSEKHHAWNSWMEKICDNARIDIENITIKIEIPLENQKCLFVLFIEKFTMFTSDENGKMIFLKENPEVLCKRILMKSFSLSFFPNSHESVSNDYQNKYNFLFPSTFSFDVIHERSKNAKFLNIFRLNFDPIFLEINHTQFEYFWLICKQITKIKLRQKFVMCIRPKNSNYEKMWHYFYRCALKIRRPHNFRIKKAILFLKKRNKFTQKYLKSLMIKSFVNKSIKKYGEDLTFLLLQYALAIDHQRKRLIKLRESEIKTLTSDDTVFFQKDSFQLVFKIQAISFKIHTLVHFVTNNFYFNFTSDKNAFIINFLLNEFNIFNEVTKKHIVRVDDNFPNILQLYFSSKNEPISLILAKLYVDLNHEFLKTLIHYFSFIVSPNNQKQVKSSNTNNYLQAINPNISKQFKVILNGINAKYSVDEFHSFHGEIHKIEIKNYSKDSTNKIINFKMKIFLGDFIIDNLIIFQKCSIKSFTKGCINEYYYVDDIQTNLYIFDVNINVDNLVIDKCSSLLKSLKELKTNKNTKTYSSHQITANCSDISVNFNTGYSLLLLNLYEIELNPKMRLKHFKIMSNQNELVCIPSLTFDKWSVFTANSIHINLDSNEFYQFLDDSFWISSKLFSLYEAYFISEKTDNMEEQPQNENNNEIRIISHNIIYNMKNNYFINCGELELIAGEYIKIILNSCEIRNSNDKIILNVSKNIEILYCSQDKKNIFSFNLDCIFINFSYSDLCIVQYFTNDQHRQNSHINPSSYVVNKEDDLQNLITVKVNRIKISYANRLMVLSNSHLEISNQICTNIIIDQIFID